MPAEELKTEHDVIVVGLGFAGAMTAITAHDQGARVVIYEKAERFGGISILSGGGCICGTDYDQTLDYLLHTCADATPREVLEVFARGLVGLAELLGSLAAEVGFKLKTVPTTGGYPFPGNDQIYSVLASRNETYTGFPWLRGERAGATLFWIFLEQLKRRPGIEIHYCSPVKELITDGEGAVIGVDVERDGRRERVGARRAVVLCTGGFEHNAELIRQNLHMPEATSIGPLTHTGDGVLMAQRVGAALWHMWHVHGSYGFRAPGVPMSIRHIFDAFRNDERPMPWIIVDRFGRRFMNECPPCPQDTPIRSFDYYDPDIQDYPRIPSFLVYDEDGRKLGPIGLLKHSSPDISFVWSADNLREVELGIVTRAETVEALAAAMKVDCAALAETIERWNAGCDLGRDSDFRRPAGTMLPLRRPPFYVVQTWPIISNTQGGPVHDAKQRVLDPFGRPIPHLYKAGELGSIFGHLYLLGGNLSECFIGGRIAGTNAAAETSRS